MPQLQSLCQVPAKSTHEPPSPPLSSPRSADTPASGLDSAVSEPPLPPASPPQPARVPLKRRAILKAAIEERQAGKPAEEIYKTYQGQVRPNSALAMAIASVADPERKRRYALLNYVLVALLVLLALSNLMAGPVRLVLFGLCMLIFAFAIARFDGRVYPVLFLLLLFNALNILVRGGGSWLLKLPDLVLLAAIIAVAFVAQRKIFPNVGPFGVKKSADGSYIWARRLAEANAASSSLPPATPPSPAPPAATPPHRRNWWSRNWVWFVPAGCLTMLVCLALVVCAFVLLVVGAVKSSDFYRTGVARAKSDARVQAALGSNLHDGMFLPGDTRMNGSSREYEFRIPISGSKGKGTIYLVVAKSAGQYQIDNLSVKTNDGEIIDLNETNPSSVSNAAGDQSNPATAQAESHAKPLFNFLNPSRALDTSPHIRGDPDAPVTLEVFEDFACKPCAQQSESLKQLEQTYHGKVQVIFRNFPLASHPYAREAAYAAEAAGLQGRFWEMHDILYRDQARWVVTGTIGLCASNIGLSMARYALDSMIEAVRERVEADQKKGAELGVTRLPAIFLNGRLLDLRSLNPGGLRSEIDAALNGSPSPSSPRAAGAPSRRTVPATPPESSGKQRSLSTFNGSSVAAATCPTCWTSSSRATRPSRRPSAHAKPALVVASASAPQEARSFAEPTSHGFGITKIPSRAWSSAKRARRSADMTPSRPTETSS